MIPLQNGIDAAERLIPILGAQAVMGGVAQISATIAEPGVIRQIGTFMRLIFGELEGGRSARGETFLNLCQKAGFDATHSDQIMTELWMKFILLATNAAITAATRQPIGVLRDDPDIAAAVRPRHQPRSPRSAAPKASSCPDDAAERIVGFNRNAPPTMMASMAHDLIRGNRIELPWLSGKVVALGRELGVPTPVHEVLYAVLKPFIAGKPA